MTQRQNFVNNRYVASHSSATFDSVDPATGETIAIHRTRTSRMSMMRTLQRVLPRRRGGARRHPLGRLRC